MRYSRFPKIPLFGRAAREQRLELLRDERDEVVEAHAKAAFDSQKLQRLYRSFNDFVAQHLQVAFESDPEQALSQARDALNHLARQLVELEHQQQQQTSRRQLSKQALALLENIAPHLRLLSESGLTQRAADIDAKLAQLVEAKAWLHAHGKTVEQLAPIASALEVDPEQFEVLEQQYLAADRGLQQLKTQILPSLIWLNVATILLTQIRWIFSIKVANSVSS